MNEPAGGTLREKDQWSYYFQNEDILHAARIVTISREYIPLYREWLHLHDGMKILDVGCGTGEFCFFLGSIISGSDFYGIDCDSGMIAAAEARAADRRNTYHFTVGDAFDLPYEDTSFDLVVSYTFLTAVSDVLRAVAGMTRVVRTGGMVASVTAESFTAGARCFGIWPEAVKETVKEMLALRRKADILYEGLLPIKDKIPRAELVPAKFAAGPLSDVEMHSTGGAFSLSSHGIPEDVKRDYIESDYRGELKKFNRFMEAAGAEKYITPAEAERYRELLELMRSYLSEHIGENRIWQWESCPMLLMSGIRRF